MNRLKHGVDKDFTVTTNKIFHDKRLSLKAKGLWVQLLSLDEGWNFSVGGIAKLSKDGRDAVQSAIDELVGCGWFKWEHGRDELNRFAASVTTLIPENLPAVEAEPLREIPHGKIGNNKELKNKEPKYRKIAYAIGVPPDGGGSQQVTVSSSPAAESLESSQATGVAEVSHLVTEEARPRVPIVPDERGGVVIWPASPSAPNSADSEGVTSTAVEEPLAPASSPPEPTVDASRPATTDEAPVTYGKADINEAFAHWEKRLGYPPSNKVKQNRYAASNLIKKHGLDTVTRVIDGLVLLKRERYVRKEAKPVNFIELQANWDAVMAAGHELKSRTPKVVRIA